MFFHGLEVNQGELVRFQYLNPLDTWNPPKYLAAALGINTKNELSVFAADKRVGENGLDILCEDEIQDIYLVSFVETAMQKGTHGRFHYGNQAWVTLGNGQTVSGKVVAALAGSVAIDIGDGQLVIRNLNEVH